MAILIAHLKQYQGFVATPNLWFDTTIYGFEQFVYKPIIPSEIINTHNLPTRLGKRVEFFVCHDIHKHPELTLIAQNIQIQQHKQTIGELDVLLLESHKPIHLEIVYKFYLYDPTVGTTELDHWIGPNRKDSLIQKLDKLQNKQFPLLHHPETHKYLESYNLKAENINQKVLFKAQLFTPLEFINKEFQFINTNCILGNYFKKEQLLAYPDCQFYLPNKCSWLMAVDPDVSWLTYDLFMVHLEELLNKQLAPLIWIQHPDGNLTSHFVVWW